MFIIRPFNVCWFLMIAIMVGIIVGLTFLLRNKDDKTKKIVLLSICVFNAVFWFFYKFCLYMKFSGYTEPFYWYKELPLHLCNISIYLLPIGILTNKRLLKSYGVFIAPLGAIMALVAPAVGFYDNSIFTWFNIGFYGTHLIIIITGFLTVTLGYYRPNYKDVPWICCLLFSMTFVIHCINSIFYYCFGLDANYFYTRHSDGIGLLDTFRSWIPCHFVYLIPGIAILVVYICLVILPFALIDNNKKKKAN